MTGYGGLHPDDDAGHAIYEEQHRGHPDPNPAIPCADCGDRFAFLEYWQPRYVEPDDADPVEDEWLCDGCKQFQERRESNQDLREYLKPD